MKANARCEIFTPLEIVNKMLDQAGYNELGPELEKGIISPGTVVGSPCGPVGPTRLSSR